jgi:hypothetical protein
MRSRVIDILLAVAAAHAEHKARRRRDPIVTFTPLERLRFAALLVVLLVLLGLVSMFGR